MRNFQEEDFAGSGQYLVRTTKKHIEDSGSLSTIMFKIGWFLGKREDKKKYCLIAMSDGMIYLEQLDNYALVQFLNTNEKEYRFATQEEVVRVVMYQKARWKN